MASSLTGERDYLLGVNPVELGRLRFQHEVWGPVTRRFFDRLGVGPGWHVLDVGAGPGLVASDLRQRVGDTGSVVALEPAKLYLDWFQDEIDRRGWRNVSTLHGAAETAPLPERRFDLVFSRWVIGFAPEPERFLAPLRRALRPGGILAIQDYGVFSGAGIYPRGGPADRLSDLVQAYWRAGGGDPEIGARLPALYAGLGLTLVDLTPTVLAGGPGHPIQEWAHRFLTVHVPAMTERGLLTQGEGDAFLTDWRARRANPHSVFFSPLLVDAAGRAPE